MFLNHYLGEDVDGDEDPDEEDEADETGALRSQEDVAEEWSDG